MQQTLLNFKNFPTCMSLFQPAFLLNFEILKHKTMIHSKKIPKISTCMALFYSALSSIFEILPTYTFIPTCNIIRETNALSICLDKIRFILDKMILSRTIYFFVQDFVHSLKVIFALSKLV